MSIIGARPNNRRVTAHLFLQNVGRAIEWYGRAFDAVELYRSTLPDGTVVHAQVRIADSVVLISKDNAAVEEATVLPGYRGIRLRAPEAVGVTGTVLELYVDNVVAAVQQATAAGAEPRIPVTDTFYGDRYSQITDPFGHVWALATADEELTPQEVERRMMAQFSDFPRLHMEQ